VPAAAAVLAVVAAGAPDLAISTFNVWPSISWLLNFLTRNSGSGRQSDPRIALSTSDIQRREQIWP
jgi:hypothetical protein